MNFVLSMCLLLAAGCEPTVAPEDLGQVVDKLPEVPGADKPYEMPQLNPPPATSTATGGPAAAPEGQSPPVLPQPDPSAH